MNLGPLVCIQIQSGPSGIYIMDVNIWFICIIFICIIAFQKDLKNHMYDM